jgi:hypothetical protein
MILEHLNIWILIPRETGMLLETSLSGNLRKSLEDSPSNTLGTGGVLTGDDISIDNNEGTPRAHALVRSQFTQLQMTNIR